MSYREIQIVDGLGYKTIAYINENNEVLVPDGMTYRSVGNILDDGVYSRDGIFHTKKVISINPNGDMYQHGDGAFPAKEYIGKIENSGTIKDKRGSSIGRIVGSSGFSTPATPIPVGFPISPIVPFVLLAAILIPLETWVFWSNLSYSVTMRGGLIFFIVLMLCFITGCIISFKSIRTAEFEMMFSYCITPYMVGTVLYSVYALVETHCAGMLNIATAIGLPLGTAFIMLGACLPLLIGQLLICYGYKRAYKKRSSNC